MRTHGCFFLRRGGRNAFRRRGKGGLGKSFVKVKRQDVVAVGAHAEIGIGLAGTGTDDSQELVLLEGLSSLDPERGYSRLLAFEHREADEQVPFFALVIILHPGNDSGVKKTVGLIQALHGLRIEVHKPPAESTRRAESSLENLETAL